MPSNAASFTTSIAPWLSVPSGAKAIGFYQSAFEATEVYRYEDPGGGLVVRLAVGGAEFWLSQESPEHLKPNPGPVGGGSIRMILTVANPDSVFARALKAGATEVFAVGEGHGWRLGRLVDPFGLHWEIGHPLTE
jgi:PhnB protein